MIYDLSPAITPGMPVWPGDAPYTLDWTLRTADGHSVNLSRVTLSPHTGAHADAYHHCSDDGVTMEAMPLEPYLGPARVVDCPGDGPIDRKRLEDAGWRGARRLLLKTRKGAPADPYAVPFAHLTPEAVELFHADGVILVGLDTPSMDDFHSKTLDSHHALRVRKIANLENLDLSSVPAGDYELIALPLPIAGACGSPVRAVLRTADDATRSFR